MFFWDNPSDFVWLARNNRNMVEELCERISQGNTEVDTCTYLYL